MATRLRFDPAQGGDAPRFAVGVLVSSKCAEVSAAVVGAGGHGLGAEVQLAGVAKAPVPRETAALFGPGPVAAGSVVVLRAQLAEIQAAVVGDLLAGAGIAPSRVLAVGVHDPGLWELSRGEPIGYLSLCDAARLAEMTGLNVIDAFPARDLAQGGQGGPVTALAEWMLLKHPTLNRVVLDLGRTVRMTYLPAMRVDRAASRVLSFEVGPGTGLLDQLAERLTSGQHRFDPGGRLAVQGRRIAELIRHWSADPYFDRPLPRWHPWGVRPERFLGDALQMAVQNGWTVRDLLCTATHFIAETIATTFGRRLPEEAAIDQIVVSGGGQHNGMLLREIGRLTGLPLIRGGEGGMPADAIGPAGIGVLALMHLDQTPGNHTAITKAAVPRVLGRITPGSPQNWVRLLQTLAGSSTAIRPLRVAV